MRKVIIFTSILFSACISVLAQKVGVGTTTPIARLEVKGEGNTGSTNNLVLRNSTGDTLLRMRNDGHMGLSYNGSVFGRTLNVGGNGINLYKTDSNFSGALFPTDTSIVLWSEFDDNNYVILQPQWGRVGIGTYGPRARFHVGNGNSFADPVSSTVAIFENDEDVSINLLSPGSNSSAIYFGNEAVAISGGIVYNSPSVNGLAFRTNGNVTRAVINNVGDMGIGDSAPNARLHVSDGPGGEMYHSAAEIIIEDNTASYLQFSTNTGSEAGILSGNAVTSIRSAIIFEEDSTLHLRTGGNSPRMVIDQNGNVGIGTVTPGQKLHVSGNGLFTGVVIASCGILSCSDMRYKKNIAPLENSLDNVLALNGIYYTWDKEKFSDRLFDDKRQIGFSAQEMETVFPEMVHTDEQGYKSVDYSRLTPVLVEAIKEQQEIISSQQTKLDSLQVKIDSLQTKFESLEKEMQALKDLIVNRLP